MLKSKYSNRIIIPVIWYLILVLFTIKYSWEIIINGYFLFPIAVKSQLLDYMISIILLISIFSTPFFIANHFVLLNITDKDVQFVILFFKSGLIRKEDIVCSIEKESFSRYSMPNKYFIINDKNNPKIKIKISEYYIRNYEDIRDSCFLLSNSKDNDHEKNRNTL